MLIGGKNDRTDEVWVERVLLLFRCLEKGKVEGKELAVVCDMKWVPSSDEEDEALECVCLQFVTASSVEERKAVEEEAED